MVHIRSVLGVICDNPRPECVNCIQTAIDIGFRKSLIASLILTQACLFLGLWLLGYLR